KSEAIGLSTESGKIERKGVALRAAPFRLKWVASDRFVWRSSVWGRIARQDQPLLNKRDKVSLKAL
ncbi:MAG: hypothetical protein ACO37W_17770, partial [Prochlorotrichaceae cyanobacterium]